MFRRKTVITFEKLERYYLYAAEPTQEPGPCESCGREVRWLTPDQTVALTGLTLREVFRRIESNEVHFSEVKSGLVQICQTSLEL